MKRLLPSVFFLLSLSAWSQTMPGFFVADTVTMPCPWDTNQTILTYSNWEAYQTMNNEWDGPRDSNICIDLAHVVGTNVQPRILASDVDTSRAVFVRTLLDSTNIIALNSNEFYGISAGFFESPSNVLDISGTCANGICSGLLAAVRVPDSAGTGSVLRWYQKEHDPGAFFTSIEMCLPTERFAINDLRECIYKVTFVNTPSNSFVTPFSLNADPLISFGIAGQLTEASMSQFQMGQFDYYLYPGIPSNYLVMYEDTTYPSPAAISYLDILPVPNIPTPDTVNLTIDAYTGLVFQPFSQFRGGLVDGSTTQHHFLEINDMGMDLCLSNWIIELLIQDEVRYVHHGGYIDFQGERSCFLVGHGGTFAVEKDATLHYGNNGKGMMALKTGAKLELRPGSELVMQGTLILYEYAEDMEPQDIYMTLPQGAKLTFAPGSHITNQWSIGQDMKLYVYLDGGSVDMSGLPAQERELIVLVPLPKERLDQLTLFGNPAGNQLMFGTSVREQTALQVRVVDPLGRLAMEQTLSVPKGPSRTELDVTRLRAGHYVITVSAFGQKRTARFVKE